MAFSGSGCMCVCVCVCVCVGLGLEDKDFTYSLSLFNLLIQNIIYWVACKQYQFLQVMESGSPRLGSAWLGSSESLLLVFGFSMSHMSSYGAMEGLILWVSFIKALIPFTRAPPSWPQQLSTAPPPNTITLGVRISTYEWGVVGKI